MTLNEFETTLILLGWQKVGAGRWSQDDYELDAFNPYHVNMLLKAGASSKIYSIGAYSKAIERIKNANIYPKELSGA